ncbi:MAG TPA: DivIVA domain-containing protein [Microcoleaceae cyanobacterium]|jgi:F0F1-type ATP synthase membrane subunit b/b'
MLRQDPSGIGPEHGINSNAGASQNGVSARGSARVGSVDIQQELDRLEEIILESPRIPLSRRTLIDEEQLIEQLDLVRLSLPDAFHEAESILRHKEEIFLQAEQYAQEIIETAERRAAQILNETGIVRQAEMEAQQIRQHIQQECDAVRDQTINEIERMRRQAQQELEEMHQMAMAECEEIQAGADEYAERVLRDMEMQLAEMLRVIRNGRQQLVNEQSIARANNAAMMRPRK